MKKKVILTLGALFAFLITQAQEGDSRVKVNKKCPAIHKHCPDQAKLKEENKKDLKRCNVDRYSIRKKIEGTELKPVKFDKPLQDPKRKKIKARKPRKK